MCFARSGFAHCITRGWAIPADGFMGVGEAAAGGYVTRGERGIGSPLLSNRGVA